MHRARCVAAGKRYRHGQMPGIANGSGPGAADTVETERLRLAAELTTQGLWDWDLRTGDLWWSPELRELLGAAPETLQVTGEEFVERVHPDDRERVGRALRAHLDDGAPYDLEFRMLHEDGREVVVLSRGRAFRNPEGEAYRMAGVLLDISPSATAREALRVSERRYRDMSASVPGALYQYVRRPDGSDALLSMSEGCFELFEITADEACRDVGRLWAQIHPDDLQGVADSVAHSERTLEPWLARYRNITPSGKQKWVYARGMPRRLPDGGTLWTSILFDVSERVQMEEQLKESRELLFRAQKMDALGQLTGGLAHDFNNLLSVILSGLETLGELQPTLPQEQRAALDDAFQATRRGAALTRSLLGFARRAELAPVVLALEEVVAVMRPLLRRTLPANIAFGWRGADGPARVLVDRAGLESTLLNLVLNARDALPSGGRVGLSVTLRPGIAPAELAAGDYVELAVEDDGEGMTAETLARVFEPFFTTKGRRGSGMGLAMTHGFVQQSGGRCDVSSLPGEGTRVSLLFPRAPTRAKRISRPALGGSQRGFGHIRLLFVEDEDAVRRSVARGLRRAGFELTVARDGEEARKLLRASSSAFDVVVSDLRMPGAVQGEHLADEVGHAIPVIVVSGNPPEGGVRGAVALLTKPVALGELVGHIAAAATKVQGR